MTTSRIVRGTKARIVIGLCAILAVTAIIACYNSTLTQLEDAKKSSEECNRQEENLSTQLQVISDYKQRLEKSLKTEKAEHQQTKNSLESKLNVLQTECKKSSSEAGVRFNSLQQHFNLLKTEHDDFKEKCSKAEEKQSADVSELQNKLQEAQAELKKVTELKDNLQTQITELENQYQQDSALRKELEALKAKCPATFESLPTPSESAVHGNESHKVAVPKPSLPNENFAKQPTKSTTSSNVNNPSLNGVPPLLVPSVTPENANKKLPEGVVPAPENPNERMAEERINELPNDRYSNKINVKADKKEENDLYDALAFGDNDAAKDENKQNFKKENQLGIGDNDYKDNANNNDLQMAENDPDDDDPDDYGGNPGKIKDPVVRH